MDWAKLLIARVATALFWFNPLVWRLAREATSCARKRPTMPCSRPTWRHRLCVAPGRRRSARVPGVPSGRARGRPVEELARKARRARARRQVGSRPRCPQLRGRRVQRSGTGRSASRGADTGARQRHADEGPGRLPRRERTCLGLLSGHSRGGVGSSAHHRERRLRFGRDRGCRDCTQQDRAGASPTDRTAPRRRPSWIRRTFLT